MAVTFIIGRAGSGKTTRCYERVVEALRSAPLGPAIFLLVPRQATFQVEREMTARTGGFARLRVVSFDLLVRQIAGQCGAAAVPEVTPVGRHLILGHLLRRHRSELRFFGDVAHQPGVAAELDATFAELERSGKTSADLAHLLDQLQQTGADDGQSLQAKLHDIRLLYDAYLNYLGQDRLDPHRRLTQILSQLDGCPLLKGAAVYVDSFHDFTESERRLLAGLGRACESVEINLTIDPRSPTIRDPHHLPDEMSLFHRTEDAYRRLRFAMEEAKAVVAEPVVLEGVHRFQPPQLELIESLLTGDVPSPVSRSSDEERKTAMGHRPLRNGASITVANWGSGFQPDNPEVGRDGRPPLHLATLIDAPILSEEPEALSLIEAPDFQSEVDAAARGIIDLLRQGYRLRDVAVLARDLSPYQRLIDISFPEHGLSYFVDRRRSAEHHPLLVFVRSIFEVAKDRWPMDAVMALLKTGLAGVDLLEADEIENYLIQHRLGGAAWDDPAAWAFQRHPTGADDGAPAPEVFDVRDVEAIRRAVVSRLRPFLETVRRPGALPVRDFAVAVFAALEAFGVPATLSAWAAAAADAGDLEQAGEQQQVWAELVELFEQMVDLLGDEIVSAADFVNIMESGLERFDLALTPPTVDQVIVGQVDRTRLPEVKAIFLLGVSEGQFPQAAREETIFSRSDRRELRQRRIELGPTTDRRRLDEYLLGYVALTRASQRLIVIRPLADAGGKPAEPSVFWRRLRDLFPDITPETVPRESQAPRDVDRIATPRQLLGSLMRWAREEPPRPLAGDAPSPFSAAHPNSDEDAPSGEFPAGSALRTAVAESPGSIRSAYPAKHPEGADPRAPLYQWFSIMYRDAISSTEAPVGSALRTDRIAGLLPTAWRALSYTNNARLSSELARGLFPSPLSASVRQVETFAVCPFRHFLRYGIRLTGRESPHVTGLDMSQVYHQVLQIIAGEILERRQNWSDLPPEAAREMIAEFSESVARQLRGEVMLGSARNKYLLSRIEKTLQSVVDSLREMQSRGTFRSAGAGISFGSGGVLPSYRVRTPGGADLQLSGQIDRVDVLDRAGHDAPAAPAVAVFDYKLAAGRLSLGEMYYGLSLQLLTYLLVLQADGQQIAGRPLTPAAAFYFKLLRGIGTVDHPSDALDPADPLFHLRQKPRGVFDARFLADLDAGVVPGESSRVVHAKLKKDGQLGSRDKSDFTGTDEFTDLLAFVHMKLGQIGDQIVAGAIGVRPYRMDRKSPCSGCEYRAVCRFEPGPNSYRHLTPLKRHEALARIIEAVKGKGHGA